MFYIGSSSVSKIENGYRGSVMSKAYRKLWLEEIRKNPHLFSTRIVAYYSSSDLAFEAEFRFQKHLRVLENTLYINKSYAVPNGIFGTSNSGEKNPMWGKVRLDSSIRMLMNNPMKSPLVSKKVAEKKAILYELGIHKSDRNSPESLKRSSERMCHRNPNKIRCCCIHCKKEVTPSSLTRFHKHKEKTCQ